jgi:hypothetical protein
MRRLLLLVWIVLLLASGVGDVFARCASMPARSCCCKAAATSDRGDVKRVCCCGCKVDAKAPAPARLATRNASERDSDLRAGVAFVSAFSIAAPRFVDDATPQLRPRRAPLRFALDCVWRI